ncbi:MAG: type II/IV secretion system protein [Candidatus Niyogibacteria bacterium]|nr:type II/IV secretion system protein [Candidatus Niyogibacteria bacterium]
MDTAFVDRLVERGLITERDALGVKREAADDAAFERLLLARGVSESDVLGVKSEFYGVPAFELQGSKVNAEVLKNIPEESARHYRFIPLGIRDGVLELGMADPSNIEAREAIKFIAAKNNIPYKIYVISASDLNAVLEEYKSLGGEVTKVLSEFELAVSGEKLTIPTLEAAENVLVEEAPVTKMVAVIIRHATEGKASDIHIEPSRDKLRVRFRVDGVLYTSLILPMAIHESLVSRIKIMTKLLLDEKRKPQDGRFSAQVDQRQIDFRVSTFPTAFGEKVAVRILDPETAILSLPELGLEGENLSAVEEALARPYGMILVTGPTGSGKTTTLYAMLQTLNRERYNIVSLEDPIEYNIEGVNQSQVRPEIGYTFANGLRSILRQDPDIMLVGEIRDKETAELAIHSALTGHLVLSTLHTNDAIGAVTRLMDMGVEPFLLAPTLACVIGQRLVQTLCAESREPMKVEGTLEERLEAELADIPALMRKKIELPKDVYEALPSAVCPKGTRGRLGVFEVLSTTKEFERVILREPTQEAIQAEFRRQGRLTMREDGIMKVLDGRVGLEQLVQITL